MHGKILSKMVFKTVGRFGLVSLVFWPSEVSELVSYNGSQSRLSLKLLRPLREVQHRAATTEVCAESPKASTMMKVLEGPVVARPFVS